MPPETGSVQHFSEKALLKDSMGSSLMLLHIVGAFEHLETLWAFCRFNVHVLNSDVSRQVNTRYQLSAMRAGLLAWKELHLYFAKSKDIQGGQQLLFSSEYLVHCSLVFPQIKNAFEDFLTKLTCLRLFRPMLHSNVSGQVVFPHWLRAMRTAGHHPSYKLLQSGIAQSVHGKVAI